MSNIPFIIWTFRRTGGTNLAQAMFETSPLQGIEHEPFNHDRSLGYITKEWEESRDREKLKQSIKNVLINHVLIKHCVEIIPDEINECLAEVSSELGYKHLFLYREVPTARLLSLNYSLRTGVWGKKQAKTININEAVFEEPIKINDLINHEKLCRSKMMNVFDLLLSLNADALHVSFESLYQHESYEYSKMLVQLIYDEFALNFSSFSQRDLKTILRKGGQGTNDEYMKFPRSEEFIDASNALPLFILYSQVFIKIEKSDNNAYVEAWLPMPALRHNQFIVSGVFFNDKEVNEMAVVNVSEKIGVLSHLNSPRIGKLNPESTFSSTSRFLSQPLNSNTDYTLQVNGLDVLTLNLTSS